MDAADVPLQRLVHARGRSTAIGGTHVCLRAVRGDAIWQLIDEERVTHLDGAPDGADDARERARRPTALDRELVVTAAGAPPSPTVIARMREARARGSCTSTGSPRRTARTRVYQWQAGWAGADAGASRPGC